MGVGRTRDIASDTRQVKPQHSLVLGVLELGLRHVRGDVIPVGAEQPHHFPQGREVFAYLLDRYQVKSGNDFGDVGIDRQSVLRWG